MKTCYPGESAESVKQVLRLSMWQVIRWWNHDGIWQIFYVLLHLYYLIFINYFLLFKTTRQHFPLIESSNRFIKSKFQSGFSENSQIMLGWNLASSKSRTIKGTAFQPFLIVLSFTIFNTKSEKMWLCFLQKVQISLFGNGLLTEFLWNFEWYSDKKN